MADRLGGLGWAEGQISLAPEPLWLRFVHVHGDLGVIHQDTKKQCGVEQCLKHVMHVYLCALQIYLCALPSMRASVREGRPSMFALKAPDGRNKCDSHTERNNMC